MSSPFASAVNTVGTLSPGHIVLATEWNTAVGGIYSYINNTLLNPVAGGGLNVVTTKGDLYVLDGTKLGALSTGGAGNDGKLLTADSTQTLGVKWASVANVTNLTTKGDLLGFDTGNNRVPVGTDGQFLKADSTQALGVKWDTPPSVPIGGIILWDFSHQPAMPAGFSLCDGGTYSGITTPNMVGVYCVGATGPGGSGGPAANGMGALASNTLAGNTAAGPGLGPKHSHGETNTGVTFTGVTAGADNNCVTSLANGVTGNATITPRYNTLAFIMRTS